MSNIDGMLSSEVLTFFVQTLHANMTTLYLRYLLLLSEDLSIDQAIARA